jgi:hypothetical protein
MQCKINISNLIEDDEIKYLRVYYYIFPNKIKISFYSKTLFVDTCPGKITFRLNNIIIYK